MKCLICDGHQFNSYKGLYDDRYGAPGIYNINFCKRCGFGKTTPSMKDNEIPNLYAKYYPLNKIQYSDLTNMLDKSSNFKKWLLGTNNVAHLYVRQKGAKVLDIGSASCVSLLELQNKGCVPYGIEPDPSAQKLARQLGLNVFEGFITDNPFPKIKFDYITASQTIEHTTDPSAFLSAISKKLKNEGLCILSFPNTNSVYRKIFGRMWINWHVPYHQNHFSIKSLSILVNKCGFDIQFKKTITPNLWTAVQLVTFIWRPKYKKASEFWQNTKNMRVKRLIMEIVFRMVMVLSLPFNRIIDALGFGDSLVVIISKKE